MRIRLVQKFATDADYKQHIAEAESAGVDLVCLNELATSGCLYDGGDGTTLETMLSTLGTFEVAVMIGFPMRSQEGLHNTYLYHKAGSYQLYRKVHLFEPMNEPSVYRPGNSPGLFETAYGTFGIAVCYDIRFSELFDRFRQERVRGVVIPAAFPLVRIEDWRRLLRERAVQAGAPVIGINAVGDDGTNIFGGRSAVIDSEGNVIAEASNSNEEIIEVEL